MHVALHRADALQRGFIALRQLEADVFAAHLVWEILALFAVRAAAR